MASTNKTNCFYFILQKYKYLQENSVINFVPGYKEAGRDFEIFSFFLVSVTNMQVVVFLQSALNAVGQCELLILYGATWL